MTDFKTIEVHTLDYETNTTKNKKNKRQVELAKLKAMGIVPTSLMAASNLKLMK